MAKENGNSRQKSKIRVTLDLTPGSNERLERLQRVVNARSKAEVLRESLRLYEWAVEQFINDGDFYVRTKSGETERVVVLGLDKM